MSAARATPERPGAGHWVPRTGGLDALRDAVHDCRGCELWSPAIQAVFSEGPPDAAMVLVGEQPGDREDQEGEPFVGPAGRVLRDALEAAEVDPESVYVTNAVKHFRFDERGKRRLHKKPGVPHIEACHPWLGAELATVEPQVVVCMGATAGRAVLGRPVKIGAERGRVIEAPGLSGSAMALITSHPSAILRLRGRGGWEEAFAGLVADLRVAARAAELGGPVG